MKAVRSAGGRRGGRLSGWHPVDLGATVLNSLASSVKDPSMIDDVYMGCVSQAGQQAMNVARNAALVSDLPESVPATTIDRQCGSSQQALHFAAQAVMSGVQDIVIAAGVESMSRVPLGMTYQLAQKNGLGFYMSDRLLEKYGVEFSQFMGAEMMAKKYEITQEELTQYSLESHMRAAKATKDGLFDNEILPLDAIVYNHKEQTLNNLNEKHYNDEGIRFDATFDSIHSVKPIQEGGLISAATASQICDGASGLLVVNDNGLKHLKDDVTPIARIHHMSVLGHDPVIMLEAPLPATDHALKKAGLSINDIDAFEVNEAFASVPLAWLKHTKADPSKVNVNGGAIALGHPLGASGTKLMTTLCNVLKQQKGKFGLLTMCEGGGMANVTIVENLM